MSSLSLVLVIFLLCLMVSSAVRMGAGEVTPDKFQSEVVSDAKVWLVEFYSGMCGSCKEFSPIWTEIVSDLKGKVNTGKVNIDTKEGAAIAERVGALEDGLPAVIVFMSNGDDKGVSLKIDSSNFSKKVVMKKLKSKIGALQKDESGHYLKKAQKEL